MDYKCAMVNISLLLFEHNKIRKTEQTKKRQMYWSIENPERERETKKKRATTH